MRRALLSCAAIAFAIACGDSITEPIPDRKPATPTVSFATSTAEDGLTITTDKDDYAPGDTVHFTGTGWQPGDVLDIVLVDDSLTQETHTWSVNVGEDGTFHDSTYVVDTGDIGVTFSLTATSQLTGRSLTVVFTDGNFKYTTAPANLVASITLTQRAGTTCPGGMNQGSVTATYNTNVNLSTSSHYVFSVPAVTGYTYNGYTTGNNNNITVSPASDPSNNSLCIVSVGNQAGTIELQYLENTTTELGHSPAATTVGQPVTFTATVKDHNSDPIGNKGSVTFYEFTGVQTCDALGSATALAGPINLTNNPSGQASFQTSTLVAGTHVVTGCYGGTSAYKKSFGSVSHVVNVADAQAPTINCTVPSQSLWSGNNVTVSCTASDAGSGLKNAADASFSLTTNVPNGTETSSALTGSHQVCDNDNNCATAGPYAFQVDRKAPSFSCNPADGVWHASDVSIACTASDGGSGVSPSSDASFSLSTSVAAGTEAANASTGSKSVLDAVGNSVTAGPISGNKVDKKAPTVTCGTADGSWHASDVSIPCTALDNGSGLDDTGDASFNLFTSEAAGTETANAMTASRSVLDAVGNSATAGPIGGNKVDKKGPTATCDAADGNWHAADVSIHCTAADGGSGLDDPADASFNLLTTVLANTETNNAMTGSRNLLDAVGNTSTAGPVGGNKVDKKAPAVSCGAVDGNWHGSDVSIGCTGSDGGSGLEDPSEASFDLTTNVPSGTETANASTNARTIKDAVGHSTPAGPFAGNKVDKKDPTVACGAADGAWHASDVSIACTASDGGSGVSPTSDESFSLHTSVAAGTETADASTGSKVISDLVGNTKTAGPISGNKVDKKDPAVSCAAADGAWHGSDALIACTASDGGSGLKNAADANFSLSTSVPAGSETGDASTNSRAVLDAVNNSTTAGPIAGNKVDKKGPTVALTCPASPLLLNAPANANWTASDGGSGVASGYASGSFGVPTGSVGPKTATAAAGVSHDNVDNPSSASAPCGYSVAFGFAGFFTPVDNGLMNGANSGQAIPVKWTLTDYAGHPVTTLTSVNVTAATLACDTGTTLDQIEEYATGASGLINKGDGSYQFNWKTPTSYARSCKTMKLDLGEGTPRTARFEFKK